MDLARIPQSWIRHENVVRLQKARKDGDSQIQVPHGAVFDAIRVQRRSFWEAILPDVSIKNERQSQLIQEPVWPAKPLNYLSHSDAQENRQGLRHLNLSGMIADHLYLIWTFHLVLEKTEVTLFSTSMIPTTLLYGHSEFLLWCRGSWRGGINPIFPAQILPKSHFPAYCFSKF